MALLLRVPGALLLAAWLAASAPSGRGPLVRRERGEMAAESRLQGLLEEALRRVSADRLFAVEESIKGTYEAFPKNAAGKIPSHEVFAAIVRSYFAKEHGWMLSGLEPTALVSNATQVHGANILRDKAPGIAAALGEALEVDKGASLSDVVRTIVLLEKLVLAEPEPLLHAAYALNELSSGEPIGNTELHEILQSYLLLIRLGYKRNRTSKEVHHAAKEAAQASADWAQLVAFERHAVAESGLSSPYAVSEVWQIAEDLSRKYGKWQNQECTQMKETLMGLGHGGAPGVVSLEAFWAEPAHSAFRFTESKAYLGRIGALEEPKNAGDAKQAADAQVRIANYLLGPSNCIAPSGYHVVCCLNECEGLVSEVELKTRRLEASAAEVSEVIASTPSATVAAPRKLAASLAEELGAIEGRHGGFVPIHSADFKRWLHGAFPNECAVPTVSEGAAEDAENAAAHAWMALQEECTRIPAWQAKARDVEEGLVV